MQKIVIARRGDGEKKNVVAVTNVLSAFNPIQLYYLQYNNRKSLAKENIELFEKVCPSTRVGEVSSVVVECVRHKTPLIK